MFFQLVQHLNNCRVGRQYRLVQFGRGINVAVHFVGAFNVGVAHVKISNATVKRRYFYLKSCHAIKID